MILIIFVSFILIDDRTNLRKVFQYMRACMECENHSL